MGVYLRPGSRGPEVRAVQLELNRLFNAGLNPTGFYGHDTTEAVRRFQRHAGFPVELQTGIFGPKTFVALFKLFDLTISADLKPKANPPATPPANPPAPPNTPAAATDTKATTPAHKDEAEPPLMRTQLTFQLGGQYSRGDGPGGQAQLAFTYRSPYLLHSPKPNPLHRYLRTELNLAPTLGIPAPGSSIYTGQINLTVAPVTDWLVYHKTWHFLNPSLGTFFQAPLNRPNPLAKPDPSSSTRLGGTLGLELFHVDLFDNSMSLGVSGQEAVYYNFNSRKVVWDPSAMIFIQFNLGNGWWPYKSK